MRKTLKYGLPVLLAASVSYFLLQDHEAEAPQNAPSVLVYSSEEAENGERSRTPILPNSEIETSVPSAENSSSSPLEERAVTSEQSEISTGDPQQAENAASFMDSYVEACGGDLGLASRCILLAEADTIPPELINNLRAFVNGRGQRWAARVELMFTNRERVLGLLESWETFGDFSGTRGYQQIQQWRASYSIEIDSELGYDIFASDKENLWSLRNLAFLPPEEITPELIADLEEIAQNELELHSHLSLYVVQSLLRGYEKYGNFAASDPPSEISSEDDVWHGRLFTIMDMLFSLPRASEQGSLRAEEEARIAGTVQYVQELVDQDANHFIGRVIGNIAAPSRLVGFSGPSGLELFYQTFEIPPGPPLSASERQEILERLYPTCPPF